MVINLLRAVFILLLTAVTLLYVLTYQGTMLMEAHNTEVRLGTVLLMLFSAVGVALAIIAIDVFNRNKKLSSLSGLFLGLIVGLIAAYALSFVVDLVGMLTAPEAVDMPRTAEEFRRLSVEARAAIGQRQAYLTLLEGVKVIIGIITCYIAISMVLQTKDDFRFVIPYVEFAKELRGSRPILLDTSVVIDGRILDIIQTRIMQGTLIVPRFVLNELQLIADSSDKLRRARGRRGLEILQKLQDNPTVEVRMEEVDAEGSGVDQKLVVLAQQMKARVMTNDYNLNKIATLRGVEVINLNDLAKAMRPVVLPGEHMTVRVIKPGESPTQAVGYLDDGTMVVVENARQAMGDEVELTVTSTLQTSAGRMIFGRLNGKSDGETPEQAPVPAATETSAASERPRRTHSGRNPRRA